MKSEVWQLAFVAIGALLFLGYGIYEGYIGIAGGAVVYIVLVVAMVIHNKNRQKKGKDGLWG